MNSQCDDTANDPDISKLEDQYSKQKQFFENFAWKVLLYDPLDRPLPNEEEPQSTKRDELLKIVETELTRIDGKQLKLPLCQEKYKKLQTMFDECEEECK